MTWITDKTSAIYIVYRGVRWEWNDNARDLLPEEVEAMAELDGYVSCTAKCLFQPKLFGSEIMATDSTKVIELSFKYIVATSILYIVFSSGVVKDKPNITGLFASFSLMFIPSTIIVYFFSMKNGVGLGQILSAEMFVLGALFLCLIPISAIDLANGHRFGELFYSPPNSVVIILNYAVYAYLLMIIAPKIISGMTDWSYFKAAAIWIPSLYIGSFMYAYLIYPRYFSELLAAFTHHR